MKKEFKLLCMTLSAVTLLTSCLSEEHEFGKPSIKEEGKGTLVLNLNANAEFNKETRAVNESEYENTANYTVLVIDKDGKEVLNIKGSEISANLPIKLPIGQCTVKAFYGEELAASQDKFYMYGEKSETIESDGVTKVNVDCYPTCAKLKVAFDSEMSTYFNNYYVDFSGTSKLANGKFQWAANNSLPYYVAITEGNGETVNFTVTMTAKDEYESVIKGLTSKTGTISGSFTLKRQDFYTLKVKPNYTPPVGPTEGSLSIEITIDDTTNDVPPINYEVPVDWI